MTGAQAKRSEARTRARKARWLEEIAGGASVRRACAALGMSQSTYAGWLKVDADFAAAYAEAVESGTQALEDEAWRRGVQGVERPVYQGGKLVGGVQEYSDNLLMFLLRGRRPQMYRDNLHMTGQVDHTHKLALETVRRLREHADERRKILADRLGDLREDGD